MRVSRWGNSLAVRLPAKLVEELGLKEGDELKASPKGANAFEIEILGLPDKTLLLTRVAGLRRPLPDDYRFDRDEANER